MTNKIFKDQQFIMHRKYVTIMNLYRSLRLIMLKIGSNTVFGLLKYIHLFYREKCHMTSRRWYFVCNYSHR